MPLVAALSLTGLTGVWTGPALGECVCAAIALPLRIVATSR
ncbi:hypothetical protein [Actinoplanes sp. G11-F43]